MKELSEKNKWYVSKDRTMELRYFVKQYNTWRKSITELNLYNASFPYKVTARKAGKGDYRTEKIAIAIAYYSDLIEIVDDALASVDPLIAKPILLNVTNDIPYTMLAAAYDIPYGRDLFYEKVCQFIWTLDKVRK